MKDTKQESAEQYQLTDFEKELVEGAREFAEFNDEPFSVLHEGMIVNAVRTYANQYKKAYQRPSEYVSNSSENDTQTDLSITDEPQPIEPTEEE